MQRPTHYDNKHDDNHHDDNHHDDNKHDDNKHNNHKYRKYNKQHGFYDDSTSIQPSSWQWTSTSEDGLRDRYQRQHAAVKPQCFGDDGKGPGARAKYCAKPDRVAQREKLRRRPAGHHHSPHRWPCAGASTDEIPTPPPRFQTPPTRLCKATPQGSGGTASIRRRYSHYHRGAHG